MNECPLETDLLAVGLTKPSTKLGIPFSAFYLSMMFVFFSWLIYQSFTGNSGMITAFFFLCGWLGIYAVMFIITNKDVFGLNIIWVKIKYFRSHVNHSFWNHTDSYTP